MENLVEEIKRRLRYEPETGKFFWVNPLSGRHKGLIGKEAGYSKTHKGQTRVFLSLGQQEIPRARAAFIWMTGKTPQIVDHISRIPYDDRWVNLREVNVLQNNWNRSPRPRTKNFHLPTGVRKCNRKFGAVIKYLKKVMHLGVFNTPEEAHKAYLQRKKELHGEFCREVA